MPTLFFEAHAESMPLNAAVRSSSSLVADKNQIQKLVAALGPAHQAPLSEEAKARKEEEAQKEAEQAERDRRTQERGRSRTP